MVNSLKVTISGSFKTATGDIESYENITGIIPPLDEDKAQQMVVRRFAKIWITQAKKMGPDGKLTDEPRFKRISRIREVFIDNIEPNDDARRLSYVGKSIMELNFEELQDMAAAKDLAAVPLYKLGSLTHARRVAFSEYAIKLLGLEEYAPTDEKNRYNLYDYRTTGFNPARFEPILVDGTVQRSKLRPATLEETIDRAALALKDKKNTFEVSDPSKAHLTMAQLKEIADLKKIKYHATIGYEALYNKLYGVKEAA